MRASIDKNFRYLDREMLEYILDFLPDAMFAIDKEGRVIKWNKAVEDMTGVKASDIIGKGDYEVAVPFYGYKRPVLAHYAMQLDMKDLEKNYSTVKREGNVLIAEIYVPFPGYRKEGAWLWGRAAPLYDNEGNIIGAVEVVRDITERKKIEEERILLERKALEADKNKSIEILAAGVAHDFNNILMAILGYADLINISSEDEKIKNYINSIKKAILRGSELSQQLLRFAGKTGILIESVNPIHLINDIIDLLKASISKKIDILINPNNNEELWIRGDATQLRQIILNLVLNSAEAIGDKNGFIKIDISKVFINKDFCEKFLGDFDLSEGFYVKIEVVDNGCGMDENTIKHIFDPFFTTKFAGRGLGMAEVLGIVKAHKGAIRVTSSPNKGTSFEIYLPASDKKMYINEDKSDSQKGLMRFSGLVLLVDDEELIRISIETMLKKLGFESFIASNGEEALKLYITLKKKPEILIIDILMPVMDGIELLREVRKISPNQKAILISGFTGNKINLNSLNKEITAFIQKPFDIHKLSDVIANLTKKQENRV